MRAFNDQKFLLNRKTFALSGRRDKNIRLQEIFARPQIITYSPVLTFDSRKL